MQAGALNLNEITMNVEIVVEVNNPNNIGLDILSMRVDLFYPQGSSTLIGNATLPEPAVIKKADVSTFTVLAKIVVQRTSAPATITQMLSDCARTPFLLPMTATLQQARVKILSTSFDVPGLPFSKNIDVNCPS